MRVLVIILALASLGLLACSSGATSPAADPPTITPMPLPTITLIPLPPPTATPSVAERLETKYPDVDYEGVRAGIRETYAWPFFNTDQFCRSLQGLSAQEAWDVFDSVVTAYGYALPEYFDDAEQAGGALLKEECARMY